MCNSKKQPRIILGNNSDAEGENKKANEMCKKIESELNNITEISIVPQERKCTKKDFIRKSLIQKLFEIKIAYLINLTSAVTETKH